MTETIGGAFRRVQESIEDLIRRIDREIEHDEADMAKWACERFGLVGLPRDADGTPIHVDDTVAYGEGSFCSDVASITFFRDGSCRVYCENGVSTKDTSDWHVVESVESKIKDVLTRAVIRSHISTLKRHNGVEVGDLVEELCAIVNSAKGGVE